MVVKLTIVAIITMSGHHNMGKYLKFLHANSGKIDVIKNGRTNMTISFEELKYTRKNNNIYLKGASINVLNNPQKINVRSEEAVINLKNRTCITRGKVTVKGQQLGIFSKNVKVKKIKDVLRFSGPFSARYGDNWQGKFKNIEYSMEENILHVSGGARIRYSPSNH